MPRALNLGVRVSAFIEARFRLYLARAGRATALCEGARMALPPEIADRVDIVSAKPAYRDGLIIQSAYGLLKSGIDLTKRHEGARTVSERLGDFLASNHISGVKSAYQLDFGHLQKKTVAKQGLNASSPLPLNR